MFTSNAMGADRFIKHAYTVHGHRYDYSMMLYKDNFSRQPTQYINIDSPIFITCLKHGEFIQTPKEHLQGKGCPDCYMHRNIDAIKSALFDISIQYEQNFVFPTCSWKFKFDFYLPDYDVLIQFNDLEHSVPFVDQGGAEQLRMIKQNDMLKDVLARQMRVKVIYITPVHLRCMSREELGDYINNIIGAHKYGNDFKIR